MTITNPAGSAPVSNCTNGIRLSSFLIARSDHDVATVVIGDYDLTEIRHLITRALDPRLGLVPSINPLSALRTLREATRTAPRIIDAHSAAAMLGYLDHEAHDHLLADLRSISSYASFRVIMTKAAAADGLLIELV